MLSLTGDPFDLGLTAAAETLESASHKMAEEMYRSAGESGGGDTGGGDDDAAPKPDDDDDVVDAEFEETEETEEKEETAEA